MKKKLIGFCGVDSGTLMISDPCYLKKWNSKIPTKEQLTKEKKFIDENKFAHFGWKGILLMKDSIQLDQGVGFSTGVGDGTFPVYAIYSGKNLIKIEVNFKGDK